MLASQAQDIHLDIDAAVCQFRTDRASAVARLNELFSHGLPPSPAMNGRYRGALLTTSVNPLLDGLAHALLSRWLPWKGKTFDAATQTGDNMFTNDGLWLSRLVFMGYRRYQADGEGRSRALEFRTYVSPGQNDPGQPTLKLDYNLEVNPSFVVRDVLDELVQVDSGYYLGKAHLHWRGRWRCAAYFTLEATSAA